MQVAKPKKGYKLVKTSFGKYEEIPEEWSIEKFKDFVSLKHGFAFSSDDFIDSNGIKIVKIGDIRQDYSVRVEDLDQVSIEIGEKNDEFSVVNGDILMALTGATLGKTGIVSTDEKLLQNQRVGNIFPTDSRMLEKKFLFFILTSDFIQNQVWSFVSSSAQPNIGKSELDKINFFKPRNISEQKQITSILSNVDDTLQKTNQIIEQTQHLKKGMMQKLLTRGIGHTKFKKVKWLYGNRIEIPEEWEVSKLNNFATVHGRIGWRNLRSDEYLESGFLMLSVWSLAETSPYGIDFSAGIKRLSKFRYEESPEIQLHDGDVLVAKDGDIGRIGFVKKLPEPTTVNSHVVTVRVNNESLNPEFLFWFFRSYHFQSYCKAFTTGTTIPLFPQKALRNSLIAIPTKKEQKQIASILSNVDTQIQKEKLHKSNLERLKKGLMQKLLTGQIRVKVR